MFELDCFLSLPSAFGTVEGVLGGDFAAASIHGSTAGGLMTKMKASRKLTSREIQTARDLALVAVQRVGRSHS
jgi:hypothetical protein